MRGQIAHRRQIRFGDGECLAQPAVEVLVGGCSLVQFIQDGSAHAQGGVEQSCYQRLLREMGGQARERIGPV